MRITRRAAIALGGTTLLATPALAQGQPWPNRPVRLISPFAPGGPQDVPGRFICEALTPRLGQPMVYDSRAGAGGAVGLQYVARETDGHTFLITSTAVATLPALRRDLGFDVFTDLLPVTLVMQSPFTLVVRANGPRSFKDLLATARANPGKITFGTSGVGSSTHLTMAMLMQKANLDMTHVPYRGAQLIMNALLAGDIDIFLGDVSVPLEHIRAGTARCIAVTSATRAALLPDAPAVAEEVPGYSSTLWYGFFASKATPPEAMQRMIRELTPFGAPDSELRRRLAALGAEAMFTGPGPLAERLKAEVPQWKAVVQAAAIAVE